MAYDNLHAGRYQAGFKLLEYRWHPDVMANVNIPYKKTPTYTKAWQGESLLGKTIVVQMEQGFGDIIMFARFLPALKVLGAKKLIVYQHSSMHHLLGQLECVDQFTNQDDVYADYWIGSLSLPYYLSLAQPYCKTLFPCSKDYVVSSEGYLEATPSNIPRKIGVNWGTSKGPMHFIRSIDDVDMLDLVGEDSYSLNPDTDGPFISLPNDGWKRDFSKTAAHIKAMKGVVTVDTATAHLAGALGVKCLVLMPKPKFCCWRWKHAPWYDSVTPIAHDEYHLIPEMIRSW